MARKTLLCDRTDAGSGPARARGGLLVTTTADGELDRRRYVDHFKTKGARIR